MHASKFEVMTGGKAKAGNESNTETSKKKNGGFSWSALLIGMGLGGAAYALILRAAERQYMVKQTFAQQAMGNVPAPQPMSEGTPKVAIYAGNE